MDEEKLMERIIELEHENRRLERKIERAEADCWTLIAELQEQINKLR